MMKRFTALLLLAAVALALIACGAEPARDLMEDVPQRILCPEEDAQTEMAAGNAAAADFGLRLFQAGLEQGKNTLISPLSALSALAMTANGAKGETLAQMEQVLGMDIEALNGYMRSFMDQLPRDEDYTLHLANSVWFRDDPDFTVEQSFLQTNGDYYEAGAYKAGFDEDTRKEINDWVSDHTGGMIPQILDEIPEEAVMYLVNALCFDAGWETVYEQHQITQAHFTTESGEARDAEMMHCTEYTYLEDETATGFVKFYRDRKYAFAALLPREGVSISRYVRGLTGEGLQKLLQQPQSIRVITAIPQFETEYTAELSGVLQEMGMTDAFDLNMADFSGLGTYRVSGGNICIDRVLHKTYIGVSPLGTRAGAATVVEMECGSAAPDPDYREVILDRPFVYMLLDWENRVPLFMGCLMDPAQE